MIELIVTCVLAAGAVFSTPEGWRVEQVGNAGTPGLSLNVMVFCGPKPCGLIEQTYVKLRRTMNVGDSVSVPAGCEVAAEAPKP